MLQQCVFERSNFALEKALVKIRELVKSQVAISENEILLACETVAFYDVLICFALDGVKNFVQLPSIYHEVIKKLSTKNLRVL